MCGDLFSLAFGGRRWDVAVLIVSVCASIDVRSELRSRVLSEKGRQPRYVLGLEDLSIYVHKTARVRI